MGRLQIASVVVGNPFDKETTKEGQICFQPQQTGRDEILITRLAATRILFRKSENTQTPHSN